MSEDNGNGGFKPYDYTYRAPSTIDAKLDTPRLLVSKKALELVGINPGLAKTGDVFGVAYVPTKRSILGRKSDLEYRVSKRIFELVKNAPAWYYSENELRDMDVFIPDAQAGKVYGIAYVPGRVENKAFKVSTMWHKKFDALIESYNW